MSFYSREAILRARETAERRASGQEPVEEASVLVDVPVDAPTDDATVTVWSGERFVAYEKWRAIAPIVRQQIPDERGHAIPPDAASVVGDCGGTRVWIVKDGERWLMFAGSRKSAARRKDFASPFLAHAIQTAEQWYGAPAGGWRPEVTRDEKRVRKAANLSAQDFGLAEQACG